MCHDASVAETELEMARRHVALGERSLARQEQIVVEMDRDNHPRAAEMARQLLDTMTRYLENAKAHVARLERPAIKKGRDHWGGARPSQK